MFFIINEKALKHLRASDPVMCQIIDSFPKPKRETFNTLHEAFIDTVIAQQISTPVYKTISKRFFDTFSRDKARLKTYSIEAFQAVGLSLSKARTIHTFLNGRYQTLEDLASIKGVGPWTVSMIRLFYSKEQDIFLLEDGGIQAALKKHFNLTNKHAQIALAKKFTPYGSIATFYLWESLVKEVTSK